MMRDSRLRDLLLDLDENKIAVPPEDLLQEMARTFVLEAVDYDRLELGSWIYQTTRDYLSNTCPDWKKILTRLVIEEDGKLTQKSSGSPISENDLRWHFLELEEMEDTAGTNEQLRSKVADLALRHERWGQQRSASSHQLAMKVDLTLPLKDRFELYLKSGPTFERTFAKYFGPSLSEQDGSALLALIAAEPEAKRQHLKQLFSVSKRPWWNSFSKRI